MSDDYDEEEDLDAPGTAWLVGILLALLLVMTLFSWLAVRGAH